MESADKQTIELNGFRHPVSAQVMLMTAEEAKVYLKFTRSLAEEFQPATMLEAQIAFSIADAQWRLNSVRALQNNLLSVQLAASETPMEPAVLGAQIHLRKAPTLATLTIYEQRIHRQFHKDLVTLQQLQAARRAEEQRQLDQAAQLLELERSKTPAGQPLVYHPSGDGIQFPLEQIEAHLRLSCRRREATRFEKTHSAP